MEVKLCYIFGINVVYYDFFVMLVCDGVVIVVVEDECFMYVKYVKWLVFFFIWQLLYYVIDYCLVEVGIDFVCVDQVVYLLDLVLLIDLQVQIYIVLLLQFLVQMDLFFGVVLWDLLFLFYVMNVLCQFVDGVLYYLQVCFVNVKYMGLFCWLFVEYYLVYEVSVFLVVLFDDCVVFIMDGCGECVIIFYGFFCNGEYMCLQQVDLLYLLGLFYEEVMDYLGFLCLFDEYKVMVLVLYGELCYVDVFYEMVWVEMDGCYIVVLLCLEECFGLLC